MAQNRWMSGAFAVEGPTHAVNAILGGLLVAVLGRVLTGADLSRSTVGQHLVDQMLRGVVTG